MSKDDDNELREHVGTLKLNSEITLQAMNALHVDLHEFMTELRELRTDIRDLRIDLLEFRTEFEILKKEQMKGTKTTPSIY